VYRGHAGIRRFVSDMDDDLTSFELHPRELHDLGERVLATGQVQALAPGSGVALENLGGFVFELRDGRIARLVSHSDPEAAHAAAWR